MILKLDLALARQVIGMSEAGHALRPTPCHDGFYLPAGVLDDPAHESRRALLLTAELVETVSLFEADEETGELSPEDQAAYRVAIDALTAS